MPHGEPFVTKKKANYRSSVSSEKCGNCRHFNPGSKTGTCDIVIGRIRPDFVCDFWGPKGKVTG